MKRVSGAAVILLLLPVVVAAQKQPNPTQAGIQTGVRDTLALTLGDAIRRAGELSEEVRLARSQVELADAQIRDVRAGALPQISANLGFTKTFASQFDQGGGFTLPDSLRFEPDSTASVAERIRYLEDRVPTAGLAGLGALFGNLPFGRENAYTASISGSQLLYSGGRVGAALDVAENFREAATFQLTEELADLELSVRTAYHRAQLASELVEISEAALAQAEQFLEQEQLRQRSGSSSELDVLRAEVAAANLRPQLVQARNAAALARLDLSRLVNVPADQPIKLTTELAVPSADRLQPRPASDLQVLQQRASISAAERQVRMRELNVKIAKAAYLPNVSLSMNYGRFGYPTDPFKLSGTDFATDWTASLSVSLPIFDGLRRNAQVDVAEVGLRQSKLQLAQLREGVRIQYEQAVGEQQRAAAEITAAQRTVEQAQRVHDLTVLRYERGLATQLEVSDARLALLQARTNLAQALSNFYVAEATIERTLGRPATTR